MWRHAHVLKTGLILLVAPLISIMMHKPRLALHDLLCDEHVKL
jgi:hypothetical protein